MLKLDTRTLPTGYFVTTENPRVVRITPGRITKLNFGATLGSLIELDLMAPAFVQTKPNAALASFVDQLVAQISEDPTVLRLNYYRQSEELRTANARLDALEKLIRARWKDGRRYKLTIERVVHRVQ